MDQVHRTVDSEQDYRSSCSRLVGPRQVHHRFGQVPADNLVVGRHNSQRQVSTTAELEQGETVEAMGRTLYF